MTITAKDFLNKVNNNEDTTICEVSDPLFFKNLFARDCVLRDVIFKESVFIEDSFDYLFYFKNCHFEKGFVIVEKTKLKGLYLNNCKFHDDDRIENCEVGKLSISHCEFEKNFTFFKVVINDLNLSSIRNGKNIFKFSESKISSCRISKIVNDCNILFDLESGNQDGYGTIEILKINSDLGYDGKLTFYLITIEELSLKGFNKEGQLFFQSIIFKDVNLFRFTNNGIFKISSPRFISNASLSISESNLGKCELFNVDFNRIKKVNIENSNIQDIVPVNVKLCSRIISDESGLNSNLREVHRQLKNVMINNNDKIGELYYHGLEMDSYFDELNKIDGSRSEKFILYTNKYSNSHGLKWTWALGWLLSTSFAIFNFNKFLLGYNEFKVSMIFYDLSKWIESLNPIRKFSDVYTIYRSSWQSNLALFIDVLSKIIYSYFIFQLISAFRKYIKK